MNERLQQLKQRADASSKSTQATLKRTAPKTSLSDIKQAAAKKFGHKPTKKQQQKQQKQNQPKQNKPKKQQPKKPKSVSSRPLEQWEQAMRKANIPAHRWRKLEDKISRLSGADRTKIEKELFDHEMFKDVYSVGEDDPTIVDDYLSDLEDKINELTNDDNDNNSLNELIDDVIRLNPDSTLSAAVIKGAITKQELTTALQVVSEKINVPADKIINYAMYSTYDVEGKTPKEGTSPMVDFQLSANAVKAQYGIDITTPEGNEKFGDMLVFEAIAAANKQKIDVKASLEYNNRIEDMREKGIEVSNKEKFELMTKTVLIEKDNDNTKLD